jgi:ribosomal protein S18 acetylase RimI-like enzyme
VREATTADIEAITKMRLALLAEEAVSPLFARLRSDAGPRARRLAEGQLARRHETTFVAVSGGDVVGMLRCAVSRGSSLVRGSHFAALTSAYVVPAHRRRHVLAALVRAADGWCRGRRVREMRLHCTVENRGGNAAWIALGFAPAEILHRRRVPRA